MDLDDVEAQLQGMREGILQRREKLSRHVHHRDEPLPQDFAEQAVALENEETMVALEDELRASLQEVDDALERLAQGTYGTCVGCGEPINPSRLDALPATARCIECAENQD